MANAENHCTWQRGQQARKTDGFELGKVATHLNPDLGKDVRYSQAETVISMTVADLGMSF